MFFVIIYNLFLLQMYFHFGCDETVLFEWWKISDVGGLIGSMIGIYILAVLYEGLKYARYIKIPSKIFIFIAANFKNTLHIIRKSIL